MKKLFSVRTLIFAGTLLLQLGTLCFHSRGAAGDVDLSFDPGSSVNGAVQAVVVQSDGKVIIGGQFTTVKGLLRTNIARLNADGSGDSTFSPATAYDSGVSSLALQSDGKVLVGGQFIQTVCDEWGCDYYFAAAVTRLNADGTLDNSFTPATGAAGQPFGVSSIVVKSDGQVLIGGAFTTMNGTNRNGIARLNANGSLDASFNPGAGIGPGSVWVSSIVVQSNGQVLIGGHFTTFDGTNRNGMARLNANGSLDASFDPGTELKFFDWYPYPRVESIVVQSDGKLIVAGFFTNANGNSITRFDADGTLDNSFNSGAGALGVVTSVAMQSDGKVVVGGYFISINGTNRNGIARLNANGSLDHSFDPGAGAGRVAAVALQTNGQVFIGGSFTSVNGTNRGRIARLNPDGSLDGSFYPGRKVDAVSSIVALPDGKVLIGGPLTFMNGTNHYASARLNGDGSPDTTFTSNSFNPDIGLPNDQFTYNVPVAVAVQSNGQVLVSGYSIRNDCDPEGGGCEHSLPFLHRVNPNGSRDVSFSADVGNVSYGDLERVISMAIEPNGRILIGGNFSTINGTNRRAIARLNADGSLDNTFVPSMTVFYVSSLALQPDGKVLLAGSAFTVNGTNFIASGIVRLNANGSFDDTFAPAAASEVSSVTLQPDGKVLIGGDFTTVNGTNRNRIARLNANGSLDSTFNSGTGANDVVRSIALQPDGKVLIGGDFLTVNGVLRPYVARLYGDSFAPSPSLNITRSNAFVIVSWPASAARYQLHGSTNLSLANSWSAIAQPAVTNAGQISVTVPTTIGSKFFRLQSQ